MTSRNMLAIAAIAAFTSVSAKAQIYPDPSDGKPIMQLGIQGFDNDFATEEAFANIAMLMLNAWTAEGGSAAPRNFTALWKEGIIDKSTMLPKYIPAGYKTVRSGLFRDARYYPKHFSGTYVLEWEGDADIRFGFGLPKCPQTGKSCQTAISKNRIEATFVPTDKNWSNFEITRIGGASLRNIRLYRKQYESQVKGGGIFNPTFVNYARQYKIIRTLDVQTASISNIRTVDALKKPGMFGYGGQ